MSDIKTVMHAARMDSTPGYVHFGDGNWLSLHRYLKDRKTIIPEDCHVTCHATGVPSIEVAGLTLTSNDIPASYRLTSEEQEAKQKEEELSRKIQEQERRREEFVRWAKKEAACVAMKQTDERKQAEEELMRKIEEERVRADKEYHDTMKEIQQVMYVRCGLKPKPLTQTTS